jgi:hypothetical protein
LATTMSVVMSGPRPDADQCRDAPHGPGQKFSTFPRHQVQRCALLLAYAQVAD